jgi:hypothetical protein
MRASYTEEARDGERRKSSSYTHRNLLYSGLRDVTQSDPDHKSHDRDGAD